MGPSPMNSLTFDASPPVCPQPVPPATAGFARRLDFLDALRGFDMFWIIGGGAMVEGMAKAVNVPILNAVVPQLEHVRWEGLHFWDVIWPLFMFIVGVSIPLSLARRSAAGASRGTIYLHAARRAAILFVLGMMAQGHLLAWDLSKLWPCYSVLHGIAAGYLIAVAVAFEFRPKTQILITAVFLLLYWTLLMLVPVPDVGAGVLTPTGNMATWIDQLVLRRFHHGENTWFVSYLGFASSVLLGVMAGHVLLSTRTAAAKLRLLASAGAGCLAAGLVWSLALPIIKLLWTSSFVLVSGGFSFLALAVFYWMVDVCGWHRWAFPFRVIGMNPIVAYMAMMLIDLRGIGKIFVGSLLPRVGRWDSLLEQTAAFLVLWLFLYWMYRTRSFVKI
jgi:predicted acyltransferase